jgi:hypothetical protein
LEVEVEVEEEVGLRTRRRIIEYMNIDYMNN